MLQDYDKTRGIYLDIDLQAAPEDRWREAIEPLADEVHQLLGEVEQFLDENIEWVAPRFGHFWRSFLRAPALGVFGRLAAFPGSFAGQEYVREIKGLAKASDIAFPRVLLANLTYDLVQMYSRLGANACSSVSCTLPDGSPALGRNLDWTIPEGVGRYTVVVRFHRKRESYVSVGVVGLVGVLSAMRPGHWAMTLNQAPAHALPAQLMQTPVCHRLRAVCDGFGSFRTVVRRLEDLQTMTPFFAHVIGVNAGEQVVVNGFGRETCRRRSVKGALIQTNHFGHEEFRHLNRPDEWVDTWGQEWVSDSEERYQALERRLRILPRNLREVADKLRRKPVTHDGTIQSMVFHPASGDWILKALLS